MCMSWKSESSVVITGDPAGSRISVGLPGACGQSISWDPFFLFALGFMLGLPCGISWSELPTELLGPASIL